MKTIQIRPVENLNDIVAIFEDDWTPSAGDLENCIVVSLPEITRQEVEDALDTIFVDPGENGPKYTWNLGLLDQDDIDFIEDSASNDKVQRINRLKNKVRQNS
jgi:hypothetical protein